MLVGWIYILVAGFFEVGFVTSLKLSDSFTQLAPTISFVVCAILSFGLLTRGVQTVPLGTAYAVWTSIGSVGAILVGILFFDEPATFARLALLAIIAGAIIGLKLIDDRPVKSHQDSLPATKTGDQ
jgi:quaternary ammonium compound-resistance protein SugE